MKPFLQIIIFALLVCLIPSAFAHRQSPVAAPTPAQKAVIQVEQRWLANEYNPAALNSILADDFVHVLPQRFISKEEQIAFVTAHPQPKFKEHRFDKLQVRVYGNTAIATGVVLAVPADTNTPQRTFFTDVFVFRSGRWQAVNSQESPASK